MLAGLLLREETYAHDSLRTNYVSKLAMAYERDLGMTHDLNGTLRTGNPFRSNLVTQYMAFVRKEQKARVEESQVPVLLHSHLTAIIAHMHMVCTVEYDTKRMTTCPVRAIEQYIAIGTALGWNMTQG